MVTAFTLTTDSVTPAIFSPRIIGLADIAHWDLGDGTIRDLNVVSHKYASAGTKTVVCTLPTSRRALEINVQNNNILTFDLTHPNILELFFQGNPLLAALDLSVCPTLSLVWAYSCPVLATLNLAGLANLHNLRIYQCPSLGAIDVSDCVALDILDASECGLTTVDLSNNTTLTSLALYTNALASIDLTNNPLLTEIDLADNVLTEAAVDTMLATLVAHGAMDGSFYIKYGPNAAPSAAGLADKATLVSRGWSVQHN